MRALTSIIALFIFIKVVEYYKKNKANRLVELEWLYSLGKYERAMAYMIKSLEKNPSSYFLNNEIAYCLINLGRAREAIKYLGKALENIPDDGYSALNNMAWASYEIGDDERCLYYCELALNKKPKAKWVLLNKGNALLRQNKLEESNICFNELLEQDESFAQALWGKGLCCTQLRDFDNAIVYYQKYCKLKPRKLSALNELANALYRKERYQEVIETFDKILAIDDRQLRAYCDKAHVLSCLGKYDEAINSLNNVLIIDSEYALAYYFKARICSHLRMREEAFKYLELAIELNPEFKVLAKDDINLNNLKFFNQFYELIK